MKKMLAVLLSITTVCCLAGCHKEGEDISGASSAPENLYAEADGSTVTTDGFSAGSEDDGSSSLAAPSRDSSTAHTTNNRPSSNRTQAPQGNLSDKDTTPKFKINSLDELNFYAVKNAIAENGKTLVSSSAQKPKISTMAHSSPFGIVRLSRSTATAINANDTFTITMYSYFTIKLGDSRGFLAQKLGGTGAVEVVITRNNFHNMITFKKGERYYSCFQSSLTEKAMSFSSHKYVSGYKLVENFDQENYEFTVYFEGDKVIGINCGRFSEGDSFRYVADDIRLDDNFCFVIHKTQSFTAAQLEGLFASSSSFVDDGVVLDDGTVLFGEAVVTDNAVAFKTASGLSVIKNGDIKKIRAMYNEKFGFCIRLELTNGDGMTGKTTLGFYLNNAKVRDVTLQRDGAAAVITDLNNKSRMSDVYYKLTAMNTGNRIGRILDHDDFVREVSKRFSLEDYDCTVEDYSSSGIEMLTYTYDLESSKSISYKASNYDVTVDGITVTLPIKVSDLINKGFTVTNKYFNHQVRQGSACFVSPSGNKWDGFVMDFYGGATTFNSCYVTQMCFYCYENTVRYQEGISPTRPDFEMLEGIHKDSTVDDIISRLGEPNKIMLYTTDNPRMNYKDCIIQLYYKVTTPSLPNGELVFNSQPVLNNDAPSDFLTDISFSLQ